MEFSVRSVRESDAESIVQVLNPIIRAGTYTIMDEPVTINAQLDFIHCFPQRGVFNVAVCNDTRQVLGLQDVVPQTPGSKAFAHIGEISTFVSLDYQGQGVGASLTRATFEAARAKCYRKICATVRADNPMAIAFYLSQGFRLVGAAEKHAFVGGQYLDEILLEIPLEGKQPHLS